MKPLCFFIALSMLASTASAATPVKGSVVPIKYGDFETWVTRNVKESSIIGGSEKKLYEVGPETVIDGAKPYSNMGGSRWATSNVLARVAGITKTSNAVFPDTRPGGGRCARLSTIIERCKAIGIVNIDVLVAGSMFLGRMLEPVTSTTNPYSKMEMGVPFTERPTALVYDYRLDIPNTDTRTYSSGFGKKKTLKGHDVAEVFILLQRRVEDADGNITAYRVGTGRERLTHSSQGWVNGHRLDVAYGDITSQPWYKPYMGLIAPDHSYYARNSQGKMVQVREVDWDAPDATPTHLVIMFSAASGDAYIGTPGLTLWVDNVALAY